MERHLERSHRILSTKTTRIVHSDTVIPTSQKTSQNVDRFIREAGVNSIFSPPKMCIPSVRRRKFNKRLANALLENVPRSGRHNTKTDLRDLYDHNRQIVHSHRVVKCSRTLKLPAIIDDYYLNVLDWSEANVVACGIGVHYYLWNATSRNGTILAPSKNQKFLTALKWIDECHLAVGNAEKEVSLWDMSVMKQIRKFESLNGRVTAISICDKQELLAEAGNDKRVLLHDLRLRSHHVATLLGHTKAVCGISFSPQGWLVASGGTDNKSLIWDIRKSTKSSSSCSCCSGGDAIAPLYTNDQHVAAVKALAWCGEAGNVLATGGGSADRYIRLFNTKSGKQVDSINSGSQVCSLLWSPTLKGLISAHGFSHNRLCMWQYPELKITHALEGHASRVLQAVLSPDLTTVASVAADQTLRFWDVRKDRPSVGHSLSPLKFSWQSHLR
jgi:cell division cycle protein 20 (cofactor of APC complex)